MKKYLLLSLLLCSIAAIADARHRKPAKRKAIPKTATAAAVNGLSAVAMRRGACFGRCPEYVLTINANGMAEYNGIRNAPQTGVYQKNIGTAQAQELLASFMKNRADTCVSVYRNRIADLPGLSFTLTINGKSQLIGNANFGPQFLSMLSEDMDGLGKVDETWKKVSDLPHE